MQLDADDLYFLYFSQIKKIGIQNLVAIKSLFSNFKNAISAPVEEFTPIIADNNVLLEIGNLLRNREKISVEVGQKFSYLEKNGISFVPIYSDKFPYVLSQIGNPPPYLFIKGELPLERLEKSVAIVGTRNPSFYGHRKAREIARDLAEQGYIIVSGLAKGTDLEAHLGALEGNGTTIAVLGSGVDKIYPEENREIADDILAFNGAIISEYDVGQVVKKYTLIQRNRIISGLASISLIIEGDLNSGTSHEIEFARKQGKQVVVLNPAQENRKISELPLKLRSEGFPAIDTANDLLIQFSDQNAFSKTALNYKESIQSNPKISPKKGSKDTGKRTNEGQSKGLEQYFNSKKEARQESQSQ